MDNFNVENNLFMCYIIDVFWYPNMLHTELYTNVLSFTCKKKIKSGKLGCKSENNNFPTSSVFFSKKYKKKFSSRGTYQETTEGRNQQIFNMYST